MKTLALLLLSALVGCSSGSLVNPSTVQAATYSNASLTGTYAVNFTQANSVGVFTSMGTFVADGAGNITAGALTEYAGGTPCSITFTGTYVLQSTAAGTASLTTKPASTAGCPVNSTGTVNLILQAAQQGQTILITESDTGAVATGTASKQ